VILVDEEGEPMPVGPGAADEATPPIPQPHEQPATGNDLGAGGKARLDA
jgi:hypothetical protein